MSDSRCSRGKCMCRQSVLLSLLLLLFFSDFLCKYTANYCHYYHYYFCVKLRRQPRTCHIVVSRYTCALKTRRDETRWGCCRSWSARWCSRRWWWWSAAKQRHLSPYWAQKFLSLVKRLSPSLECCAQWHLFGRKFLLWVFMVFAEHCLKMYARYDSWGISLL